MKLLIVLCAILVVYGQQRYNFTRSLKIKRFIMNNFKSKKSGEMTIKAVIDILMCLIIVATFNLSDIKGIVFFSINSFWYNLLIMISSMLVFIQVLFLLMYCISMLAKSDPSRLLTDIDIMSVDTKKLFYTGYFITLIISLFEAFIFFEYIPFLILQYEIPLFAMIIIICTIYGLAKAIMRQGIYKNISLFTLGFALSLTTILIIKITEGLVWGLCFIYICNIFISFKNIKVSNGR